MNAATTRNMQRAAMAAIGAAAIWTAGCARANNDRLALSSAPTPLEPSTTPSVIGISRANWQTRGFIVPADNALHHPTYTTLVPMSADAATYQCGCDPQAARAFETSDDLGAQAGDALAAPFIAGWEILTMPVAAIMHWPGSVTTQNPAYFDRYHEPVATFDLGTAEPGE